MNHVLEGRASREVGTARAQTLAWSRSRKETSEGGENARIDSEKQQAFGGLLVTQSTQQTQATEVAWLFLGLYLQRDNGVNGMNNIEKLKERRWLGENRISVSV